MTEILEKDRLLILRLTDLILENLENEHFNVNELVHQSGLTHYVLIHRIQAATGKTINQFIRETRLLKALEMLQKEDLTASEVAYKTGFGSATYFNTCFTEFFGYPPGSVKKGEIKINVKLPYNIDGTNKVKNRDIWRTMMFTTVGVSMILILIYLGKILIFNNSVLGSGKYSTGSEKSIAVLPFKNIGNNIEDMYFIDGITDEIELRLSGLNDLRVVSGPSLEQFRGSPDPPSMIARKLKVNYILNGSGQKYGNAFRLRVQLIEASTNRQIWADNYDEKIQETKDITGIQSIIAKTVAEELKTKITSEDKDRIEKTPTLSLDAYDFYQRGREEAGKLGTYDFNPEIIGRAEDFYRKAISHDKTFAQAYLGLAGLLWKRWYLDYSVLNEDNPDYYLDSMFLLANTALKYDNKNEEAYIIRGSYYSVNGSPEQAIDEYDKP
jgi:TolB-like protein/AraC-like DNA-binding protein